MKILLLHFTSGRVGGVESVLDAHATLFARHGHEVTIASGANVPLLAPGEPLVESAQCELDAGAPGKCFAELRAAILEMFAKCCAEEDVVMLHNVLTMPFHLAWTSALWQLASELTQTRFVAWVHDLAACNVDYALPHLDREPWSFLNTAHPRVEYVVVSDLRKRELVALTGIDAACVRVIPNGIQPLDFLGLTPAIAEFAEKHRILERDLVLLHPTRLVKRKNVELGLRVVAELKKRDMRVCYLVTGPPDVHNSASSEYVRSLIAQRDALGLAGDALFLHELFAVTNGDLVSLYAVSDALFYPSKQEGFGLPPLEAALHRMPIFCSDIDPMNALAFHHVTRFAPGIEPAKLADILMDVTARDEAIRGRKRVVRDFSWDAIYARHLQSLLEK